MTVVNIKRQKRREKEYKKQACGGDVSKIIKTGCAGTACWYNCPKDEKKGG